MVLPLDSLTFLKIMMGIVPATSINSDRQRFYGDCFVTESS